MQEIINFEVLSDPELQRDRLPRHLMVQIPQNGINEETGVLLIFENNLQQPLRGYELNQEKEILANQENLIVANMNYFGLRNTHDIMLPPSFSHNLRMIYGEDIGDPAWCKELSGGTIEKIAQQIKTRHHCNYLDLRCMVQINHLEGEYESWGFLAAVDGLCALGEILRRYQPNRRKIMVMGRRYGGYVAQLMGKYAPATFAAVIDNGGYCRSHLNHIVGNETTDTDLQLVIENEDQKVCTMQAFYDNPWTIEDETSNLYFGDANRLIRSLFHAPNRTSSETKYYIRHAVDDPFVTIKEKDRCVSLLQQINQVYYDRLETALPLSFVQLFEQAKTKAEGSLKKTSNETDFSLGVQRKFVCGDSVYTFQYEANYGLTVSRDIIGREEGLC